MAQPCKAVDDFTQDQRRAVAVLNVGGMDHRMYQIALGVGEDVALAALDLLARVIAARAATFSRFHALAIDHAGTGRSFATSRFTSHQQQGMIEREPQFVIAPRSEEHTSELQSLMRTSYAVF